MPTNTTEYARMYYLKNKEKLKAIYQEKSLKTVLCECGKTYRESQHEHHIKTAFHIKRIGEGVGSAIVEDLSVQIESLKNEAEQHFKEADLLKDQVRSLIDKMNALRECGKINMDKARELTKKMNQ